jgi:ABC-type multidrug transport system fused ATPase/permease subunit
MASDNGLLDPKCSLSTFLLLRGIWGHLSRRRRIQLALLLLVMLASAGAELVSLGSVLPFLAVLSDPERLWQQPLVQAMASWIGFTAASELVLPAAVAFAVAAVLAALIRLVNLWLNGRLAAELGSDLSCEAYQRTLYQPYEVHLRRNSASVIAAATTHISATVAALTSLLQLTTSAVVATGILAGLLLIDLQVALGAAALFGTVYFLVAITTRNELRRNSERISAANRQQIQALQEGLGAIRDVLLDGSQGTYVKIYRQSDRPQRQLQAKNQFIAVFSRYAVEALGLVAIAMLGGLLKLHKGEDIVIIPMLGAFALGAQRLLPALQQVYGGWASLKGYNSNLAEVLTMLSQPLPPQVIEAKPLRIYQSIRLEKVHFRYGPEQPEILQGLDLEIHPGERIGLIGSTGSGKSTMVDLLMGLLLPTAGRLLVDGKNLHDPEYPERLAAWRAAIAHVPQSIYLADSSIAENIAFGVPRQNIDLAKVMLAAEQAQIANFIESSPNGYQTFVGERGILLSGGQRQRIGIARALYKQARVLIFDEATSALDILTEKALMESVNFLSKDLTMVMIAHRLSSLHFCDRILELDSSLMTAKAVDQANILSPPACQ